MPYWIDSTLDALPAVLWVILGLGVPYTLTILPRKDWFDRVMVGAVALILGPTLLTLWMFALGTIGGANQSALLTAENVFAGTIVLALIGVALAWRKRRFDGEKPVQRALVFDEKLIIGLIVLALILRWITTSFWPFIHYDPLWVYGYQGRLWSLQGFISSDVGYYPQFMQLQYVFAQLAAGNGIDDHSARAFIPFLHLGTILMVYVLGSRLFNRRTGIIAMALWALYPHVGQWATVGDLEIPVTYGFTGAAAFFLIAWTAQTRRLRWHYGAMGGLFLGIAMWTKPTAGAFIFGVVLLVVLDAVRVLVKGLRGEQALKAWLPRFEVAFVAGLASVPVGAVWYVRNILLGHEPITMPNDFWLTQAQRSGLEFGWLLLALSLLVAYLLFAPLAQRPQRIKLLMGYALVLLATLPTVFVFRRMMWLEWLTLALGVAVLVWTLVPYARQHMTQKVRAQLMVLFWSQALAFPYFLTWFMNYSYHYRLSFAIVPLMILPTALILSHWLSVERVVNWRAVRRYAYIAVLIAVALPGVVITLYNFIGGWDWLWQNKFPTDFDRLASFNGALAYTVRDLKEHMGEEYDEYVDIDERTIIAPGLQRLPFFFPLHDVNITDAPTAISQLEGADYYIYTQEAAWYYEEIGLPVNNPITASMWRERVLNPVSTHGDPSFFSRTFSIRPPDRRFIVPQNMTALDETVILSENENDSAQLLGYRLSDTTLSRDNPALMTLIWQGMTLMQGDYTIFVHLRDAEGNVIATWDHLPILRRLNVLDYHYSTVFWQPDEVILDEFQLTVSDDVSAGDYTLSVGLYDLMTGERVPVLIDDSLTDAYTFDLVLTVPER